MLVRIVSGTTPQWAEQLKGRVTEVEKKQEQQGQAIQEMQQEIRNLKTTGVPSRSQASTSAGSAGSPGGGGWQAECLEFAVCEFMFVPGRVRLFGAPDW